MNKFLITAALATFCAAPSCATERVWSQLRSDRGTQGWRRLEVARRKRTMTLKAGVQ